MYNNTGDKRIQAKANLLIAEMAKVQAAWTGKTDYCKTPLTSHAHRHLLSISLPSPLLVAISCCHRSGFESRPVGSALTCSSGRVESHWSLLHQTECRRTGTSSRTTRTCSGSWKAGENATAFLSFLCLSLRFRSADCVVFSAFRSLTKRMRHCVSQHVTASHRLSPWCTLLQVRNGRPEARLLGPVLQVWPETPIRGHQLLLPSANWCPVFASWTTHSLHKLMAGLLDHYQLAGNEQALAMVSKMADWVKKTRPTSYISPFNCCSLRFLTPLHRALLLFPGFVHTPAYNTRTDAPISPMSRGTEETINLVTPLLHVVSLVGPTMLLSSSFSCCVLFPRFLPDS